MNIYPLLRLLADGRQHSGEELASALGISRTAIWKQLRQVGEAGLEVQAIRGQGYQLPQPLDLLDPEQIVAGLSSRVREQVALECHPVLSSTNDALMQRRALDAPYHLCLAEQQTAGKGRRGRSWVSPFAASLYLSLAFEVEASGEIVQGMSLAIGLGVAEALADLGVAGVGLKWPNDVLVKDRKIAGILVELQGSMGDRFRIVAGVGLNVWMDGDQGAAIDRPWTSLVREGQVPEGGRNRLASAVIERVVARLEQFFEQGVSALQEDWGAWDALKGRLVEVAGRDLRGEVAGIDPEGRLRLILDNGQEERLNAGEVSVRQASL